MGDIETALATHRFEHLFLECLGWNGARDDVALECRGVNLTVAAIARQGSITVSLCSANRQLLADDGLLRELQREVRRIFPQHVLIYHCETPHEQAWQWDVKLPTGRRMQLLEPCFSSSQPPAALVERIRSLAGTPCAHPASRRYESARWRAAVAFGKGMHAKHSRHAALERAAARGDPDALSLLVERYRPLVRQAARMLQQRLGIERDDAEQSALIGLLEAVRHFNSRRYSSFANYARYWIHQLAQRYVLKRTLPFHLPARLFRQCCEMAQIEMQLFAKYGESDARPQFDKELARAGIASDQWAAYSAGRCRDDVPAVQSHLSEVSAPTEINVVESDEIRSVVRYGLDLLPPRQKKILMLRYGIICSQAEHTLQAIGDELGLTRERVRQIQLKAEQKLQKIIERKV
jgi:RNA polymerase sigma factor (sigma-70 family)